MLSTDPLVGHPDAKQKILWLMDSTKILLYIIRPRVVYAHYFFDTWKFRQRNVCDASAGAILRRKYCQWLPGFVWPWEVGYNILRRIECDQSKFFQSKQKLTVLSNSEVENTGSVRVKWFPLHKRIYFEFAFQM